MTFAPEKRVLLARLALLAPLPLPFNGVVGWPEVVAFWLAVGTALLRASRGQVDVLPRWALNLLGLAYLPLLVLELRGVSGGAVLHPLAHLVLYTLAVKLYALREEKDKWHAFLAIFFLFLASIGSSVHFTVLVYLAVFLIGATHALSRFAGFEVSSRPGSAAVRHVRVPLRGPVAAMMVFIVLGSIPVFVLMPRIRQPYVFSRIAASGQAVERRGFLDSATLDTVGRVQRSRGVALRFRYDGQPSIRQPRFRTAAYDLFDGFNWRRSETGERRIGRGSDGVFVLSRANSLGAMEVWLRGDGNPRLSLPVETTRLQAPAWRILVNDHGDVSLPIQPSGTVAYRAELSRQTGELAAELPPPGSAALDRGGLTPRIEELARRVMGEGDDVRERVARLERHLLAGYDYTLELGSGGAGPPIDRFLFETQRGYCEYFATAMILMLRSQGIPARFVLGYVGAEQSRLEDYFIVRDGHAHAWVEAHLPDEGWRIYDPTPPVPAGAGLTQGARALLAQAYDYLLFRWDRYVLTYSFNDQVGLFLRLRDAWQSWWERWRPERQAIAEPPRPSSRPAAETEMVEEVERDGNDGVWRLIPPALAVAVLAVWWWRRRQFGVEEAYRVLRRELGKGGEAPLPSTPPLEVGRRLARLYPEARSDTRRVLDFYLRASFGGEPLVGEELEELKTALRGARRQYRRSA